MKFLQIKCLFYEFYVNKLPSVKFYLEDQKYSKLKSRKNLLSRVYTSSWEILCVFFAEQYNTVSHKPKCSRFRRIFICSLINSIHITQCILPGFVGSVISSIVVITKQGYTVNRLLLLFANALFSRYSRGRSFR